MRLLSPSPNELTSTSDRSESQCIFYRRWQDLKDHFRQCGKVVHADVLSDPTTGRSKGCGLVEFETAKGAAAAVGQFNKVPLRGRPLQVRPDRDDTSQSGVASNGRLFLGNLSWQVWIFLCIWLEDLSILNICSFCP
jgi:hypothetical protein